MIDNGIMKGDENGNYNMSDHIKRGDVAVMLVRAFQLSSDIKDNFSDVTPGSYYYNAIATTKSMGITKGDGRNFSPEKNITMEEAITLIERAAGLSNNGAALDDADIRGLYSDRALSDYATREDVATLLYYILTGDASNENDNYILTGVASGERGTDDSGIDAITYSVDTDEEITFDEDDFIGVFEDATGDDLCYVKFTPPSSSSGKLYYDYESSSDYDSLVKSTTKYYAESSPYLSAITFVPCSGYTGTVSISYTAYNEDGDSWAGTVRITVNEDKASIDTIAYAVDENDEITFDENDFIDAFLAATGDDLYYVKFTPPSSSYGKLYYDYDSSSDYDSLVKSTTKYYVESSPYLSAITFVPRSGYTGTVSISYKAYDEDGDSSTGSVRIVVQSD